VLGDRDRDQARELRAPHPDEPWDYAVADLGGDAVGEDNP
jgi:hypothetical protein